jgi:protein-disulfide isomerase
MALIAVSATRSFAQARSADDDLTGLSRAGEARASGPDSARVVILEFLDYACPVCATFHMQRGDSLRRALGAEVRIVYVNFPLAQHMRSFQGSEAAMCAAIVGGKAAFAGMADRLFRRQSEWSSAFDPGLTIAQFAKEAGVDAVAFADCRARDAASPLVLADLELATKFGIEGTPTFIVLPRGAQSADDAGRTSGNVPISQLTDLIAKARAKSK